MPEDILNTIPGPRPDVDRAQMFAEMAHAGQAYNQEVPYTYHLRQVVENLKKYGFTDPVMLCAGWLHDSIEDTTRSYNDIKKVFGTEVAEIVFAVSSELGRNREERNKKTYPKIRGNPSAIALKLADRLANVEYGLINGGKIDMYRSEFSSFENGIRDYPADNEDPRITTMWKHLAALLRS